MTIKTIDELMAVKFGLATIFVQDLKDGANHIFAKDVTGKYFTILVTKYCYVLPTVLSSLFQDKEQLNALAFPIICTNDDNEAIVFTLDQESDNNRLMMIYANEANNPELITETNQCYNLFEAEHGCAV